MRPLLASSLALLVFALPIAPQGLDPAIRFAEAYNTWIHLAQSRQPGILNAAELKAWNSTKAAWHDLARVADNLY